MWQLRRTAFSVRGAGRSFDSPALHLLHNNPRDCATKSKCARALRCSGLQWWRRRQARYKNFGDTWSGPHPNRFKLHWREDAVASTFGKKDGDGFAWDAKERNIQNSGDGQRSQRWFMCAQQKSVMPHGVQVHAIVCLSADSGTQKLTKTMRKLSRTRSTTAMGTDGIWARAAEEL